MLVNHIIMYLIYRRVFQNSRNYNVDEVILSLDSFNSEIFILMRNNI